ncbi:MAG: M48 family metalloprotease [Acidobacteriota bacterium]|jgi:predicted Zn-dependent protease
MRDARRRSHTTGPVPLTIGLAALILLAAACTVAIPPPDSAAEQRVIEQGAQYDEVITAQYGVYDDDELDAYVDRVGEKIAAVSEWPSLPWTFRVLDSSAVNAFAIPGGYVYVTRGLLAYMNSEAELAGVLGHEAAHVTGRHAAEQQRRATLANVGLLLGSVVSEDFATYGLQTGLAQTALSLTLLKYSRGQELESDEKGIGYAVAAGYDPSGIGSFFATLQALERERGGRGVPGWASTHPQIDDRIERSERWAAAAIARSGVDVADLTVNRSGHIEHLDGVVFGDDPRQGFFRDHSFLHPELRFRIDLPDDWQALNTRAAVQAVSPDEDALMQLTLPQLDGRSRETYIRDFLDDIDAEVIDRDDRQVNGLWARQAHFTVAANATEYEVLGTWVSYGNRLYQLLGVSTPARYERFRSTFRASFRTFDELRDRQALAVRPARIEVVTPPRAMTLSVLLQRHPEVSAEPRTIALINATTLESRLAPTGPVKLVQGDGLLLATTRPDGGG